MSFGPLCTVRQARVYHMFALMISGSALHYNNPALQILCKMIDRANFEIFAVVDLFHN